MESAARPRVPSSRSQKWPGSGTRLAWYVRRLQRMSPQEVLWRSSDVLRQRAWRLKQVPPPATAPRQLARLAGDGFQGKPKLARAPRFESPLPAGALDAVPADDVRRLLRTADEILAGRWDVLGVTREDMVAPDWFLDPLTGRRAPQAEYCFSINHRKETVTGNVKQVWELSRHHHLTLLAGAYALTGDRRYAERAGSHLQSWWQENPFLSGIHWTSGIELGLRLISWAWTRRLLDGWDDVQGLFDQNELAHKQIWWHQTYLSGFRSRGSSANNHVVAEAAGQLVAALAFPWFEESTAWADESASLLQQELAHNTFPSGVNRELAFDYHGFVAELGLTAAVEADHAGRPLPDATWRSLGRMLDVAAACLDCGLRAPRQGDSDEGRALVIASPGATAGRRSSHSGRRSSAPPSGGRQCNRASRARFCRRWLGTARYSIDRPRDRGTSATPGSRSSGPSRPTGPRSGAAATVDPTGSSLLRRTPTPTLCPSRSATTGPISWPTPARTVTVLIRCFAAIFDPRSVTTRSKCSAGTSRPPVARPCGYATPSRG